jgi:hypothetical protein
MYIPEYLKNIQTDITAALTSVQKALDTIEASAEYNDRLHPFHSSAVSTYNRLVTMAIKLNNTVTE